MKELKTKTFSTTEKEYHSEYVKDKFLWWETSYTKEWYTSIYPTRADTVEAGRQFANSIGKDNFVSIETRTWESAHDNGEGTFYLTQYTTTVWYWE